MNSTPKRGSRAGNATPFATLLDLIGIGADERISVCSMKPGGSFDHTTPRDRSDAEKLALSAPYKARNVWFGVNPVVIPEGYHGRGADEHVARCVALFSDIDVKAGGVTDTETANTVVKDISAALGVQPVAVVATGHGGHPYWALDPEDPAWTLDTEANRVAAQAVYRRFHRLCAEVAGRYGCTVDNVGQVSRILRVPGTVNVKDPANTVPVELHKHPYGVPGAPLTYEQVCEALDACGVPERTEDREVLGEVIRDSGEWEFGERTHPYVATMIERWATDVPRAGIGRHNWMLSQATRLACAHRLGLVTGDDHRMAVNTLESAFLRIITEHGKPRAPEPSNEFDAAIGWSVQRASRKNDEQAAEDLGVDLAGEGTVTPGTKKGSDLNLPESFWTARSVHAQIRQFAWARHVPPDAVINAVLAEVSARVVPSVRVDTGVATPVPIHHYAGLVGPSGGFKSTAMSLAAEAVDVVNSWSSDPFAQPAAFLVADGANDQIPLRWPLGSGQGIVAAFMGTKSTEDDDGTKRKVTNTQVRSNVLLSSDEGNDLVKACSDSNSTVGEVLRAMWSGKLAGQGNAKEENRRILQPSSYTLAVTAGFQVDILAKFLTPDALSKGDPQRWLFSYSVAPDVPAEPMPDPGPVTVTVPTETITVCGELRDRIRREHHSRLTGAVTLAPLESQRPAMLARIAALLAILEDRTVITAEDWGLAETMFDTSLRIAGHALAEHRERTSRARAAQRSEEVATAVAVQRATAGTPEEKAAERIVTLINSHGFDGPNGRRRAKWSGTDGLRVKKFNTKGRRDADAGLKWLVEDECQAVLVNEGSTVYVELTP